MVPDLPKRRGRGSSRASPVLQGILPLEGSRVPAEALAGLTLAAVGIPEVLGYAKIAGMPLVTGLYTMLLPMALYAVLGSSRHLVVAADSATAVILAAALPGRAAAGSERYVRLAGLRRSAGVRLTRVTPARTGCRIRRKAHCAHRRAARGRCAAPAQRHRLTGPGGAAWPCDARRGRACR